MCEPYHSVVQYPTNDDQGNDNTGKLQWGLGKIMDWGKKIASWFHFSKLGSGHTESIEWSKVKHLLVPTEREIRYEGAWWNRTFHIDGPWPLTMNFDECSMAQKAANEYSNVVCMGNIQTFRRYFETSLKATNNIMTHVDRFVLGMLTPKGRDEYSTKFKRCFGKRAPRKQERINFIMGFTRKRELLVPEWSDVPSLWIPSSGSQP